MTNYLESMPLICMDGYTKLGQLDGGCIGGPQGILSKYKKNEKIMKYVKFADEMEISRNLMKS